LEKLSQRGWFEGIFSSALVIQWILNFWVNSRFSQGKGFYLTRLY
jgi:hypothetical protein